MDKHFNASIIVCSCLTGFYWGGFRMAYVYCTPVKNFSVQHTGWIEESEKKNIHWQENTKTTKNQRTKLKNKTNLVKQVAVAPKTLNLKPLKPSKTQAHQLPERRMKLHTQPPPPQGNRQAQIIRPAISEGGVVTGVGWPDIALNFLTCLWHVFQFFSPENWDFTVPIEPRKKP